MRVGDRIVDENHARRIAGRSEGAEHADRHLVADAAFAIAVERTCALVRRARAIGHRLCALHLDLR